MLEVSQSLPVLLVFSPAYIVSSLCLKTCWWISNPYLPLGVWKCIWMVPSNRLVSHLGWIFLPRSQCYSWTERNESMTVQSGISNNLNWHIQYMSESVWKVWAFLKLHAKQVVSTQLYRMSLYNVAFRFRFTGSKWHKPVPVLHCAWAQSQLYKDNDLPMLELKN